MQEGWSTATDEMREMGFGFGMGLPNIKRNSDRFDIHSEVGRGTLVTTTIRLDGRDRATHGFRMDEQPATAVSPACASAPPTRSASGTARRT